MDSKAESASPTLSRIGADLDHGGEFLLFFRAQSRSRAWIVFLQPTRIRRIDPRTTEGAIVDQIVVKEEDGGQSAISCHQIEAAISGCPRFPRLSS